MARSGGTSDRSIVGGVPRGAAARGQPAASARRLVLAARAGAGVALAAGLALGVAVATPAKRRAFVAGGATGLAGAASVVLAALAAARRRRP